MNVALKRTLIFTVALFLFWVSPALAEVSVTILKGKAESGNRAALLVSAVDEAGRPIKGLSPEHFTLLVGGEEISTVTVEPISTTQEPLSLILGVDVSGSMRGKPFEETQKAIGIFLDQLEKTDFVALLRFGADAAFVTDYTTERHTIREQVNALQAADQWTHLYDATSLAIEKGKTGPPTTRTAIILLTDGRDEGSTHQRPEVIQLATGASIPIFTLGFGHAIDQGYLEDLARTSGGAFLSTPEPERIADLYTTVLDQLKQQYRISFDFAKEPGPYKAVLTLKHDGKTAKASRDFLFQPPDSQIVIQQSPQMTATLWLILGAVVLGLGGVGFLVLKNSGKKDGGGPESKPVWLEYPKDHPRYETVVGSPPVGETTVVARIRGACLRVDGLPQLVTLFREGEAVIPELMIGREDKSRAQFRKPGVVYLWTSFSSVSRPSDKSPGHARIFFHPETERFAVEDLKSTGGSLVKGKEIQGRGPVFLHDGDVIQLGQMQGVRIVYREGEPGADLESDKSTGVDDNRTMTA